MYLKNHGFTLLEVTIAAALGIVVLFALASQMSNSDRQVHVLEAKMESIQLKQELMLLLTDSTKCSSSLGSVDNLSLTSATTTDVTSKISGSLLGLVNNYKTNSRYIMVNSVLLFLPTNKTDGSPNTSTPYEFQIKITAQEKIATGTGLYMNIDGPNLSLNVAGTTVSSCFFPAMSPTVRKVTAHYSAWRWPGGSVTCSSTEHVISGGVYCYSGVGWMVIVASIPSGNGWYGACDTSVSTWANADVYALCQSN